MASGRPYNTVTMPPKEEGKDDVTGEPLEVYPKVGGYDVTGEPLQVYPKVGGYDVTGEPLEVYPKVGGG